MKNVVMMDQEEYNSMQEEIKMLNNKVQLYIKHINTLNIDRGRLVKELNQYKSDPILNQDVPIGQVQAPEFEWTPKEPVTPLVLPKLTIKKPVGRPSARKK